MLGYCLEIFDIGALLKLNKERAMDKHNQYDFENEDAEDPTDFVAVYEHKEFYMTLKNNQIVDNKLQYYTANTPKFQLYNVFKNKNRGKLHSQYIFFELFCKTLDPKYVILMDCGTEPKPNAFHKLLGKLIEDKEE
jgi:cellulose synthase/poly-beta-1,6-N-acetylglucosamine synthase-like glycosyltransferase